MPPMCGRYASFLPGWAVTEIFGMVNPLPSLWLIVQRMRTGQYEREDMP